MYRSIDLYINDTSDLASFFALFFCRRLRRAMRVNASADFATGWVAHWAGEQWSFTRYSFSSDADNMFKGNASEYLRGFRNGMGGALGR